MFTLRRREAGRQKQGVLLEVECVRVEEDCRRSHKEVTKLTSEYFMWT